MSSSLKRSPEYYLLIRMNKKPFFTPRHQKCRSINTAARLWLLSMPYPSAATYVLWTAKLNHFDNVGVQFITKCAWLPSVLIMGVHTVNLTARRLSSWSRNQHRYNLITTSHPSFSLPSRKLISKLPWKGARFLSKLKLQKKKNANKCNLCNYCHDKFYK
jgi:hypothetical protein